MPLCKVNVINVNVNGCRVQFIVHLCKVDAIPPIVLDHTEADSTAHHKMCVFILILLFHHNMCVFILILLSFWEFSNLVCEAGLVAS